MTWLFQHVSIGENNEILPIFQINLEDVECYTPRRNKDIITALEFVNSFRYFSEKLAEYFSITLTDIQKNYRQLHEIHFNLNFQSCDPKDLFLPIIPILLMSPEDQQSSNELEESHLITTSTLITTTNNVENVAQIPNISDTNDIMNYQIHCLDERISIVEKSFPSSDIETVLITRCEGKIILLFEYIKLISERYRDCVDFIEELLRKQLIAAIGKTINFQDFNTYMRYHNTKLFQTNYQPKPFCYAIRRSLDHSPEGIVSVEFRPNKNSLSEPIDTFVHELDSSLPLSFMINASTEITFHGQRYLHGYLRHEFEYETNLQQQQHQQQDRTIGYSLKCEARQFSSFIVLIGKITSSTCGAPS